MAELKTRSLAPEILDQQRPGHADLESTVRFLSWINRWLGGVRAIRNALQAMPWTGRLHVLDVGTGDANVPRALTEWARATGRMIDFVGFDREPDVLALARERSSQFPELRFVCGDVRALPFPPNSFDVVISSLFLHHLTDDEVIAALHAFASIARRGIVINDLLRRQRLYAWTKFFTWFGNDIVRYDGPLSVRKSFTAKEIEQLARRAGLPWLKVRVVFGHRFLLWGETPA